jgi:hypothetical protein
MITINRKDTYDRSNGRLNEGSRSVRRGSNSGDTGAWEATAGEGRVQLTGGGAARSGPVDAGGAHGAEDSQQADAGDDRGPRQHDCAAKHSHRRPQVPAGDANQLRRRRRITNRGLRAPAYGARYSCWSREEYHYNGRVVVQMVKRQATSVKRQAASFR